MPAYSGAGNLGHDYVAGYQTRASAGPSTPSYVGVLRAGHAVRRPASLVLVLLLGSVPFAGMTAFLPPGG